MMSLILQIMFSVSYAELPCSAVVFSKPANNAEFNEQVRCARTNQLWVLYYELLKTGFRRATLSADEISQIPSLRVDLEEEVGRAAYDYLVRVRKLDPKTTKRLRELAQVFLFRDRQFQKSSLLGVWMKADNQLTDESIYIAAASFYLRKDPSMALKWLENLKPENKKLSVLTNLLRARSHLALGHFDLARDHYLQTPAEDPLWLDAMLELGWAYIHRRDFSGSIGQISLLEKMPLVVAPASSAQQTIGYLSLCQYPSAYRALTMFEQKYSEWRKSLESMSHDERIYQRLIAGLKDDSTSAQIYRTLARQRDFINWQKAINVTIDEEGMIRSHRDKFTDVFNDQEKELKSTQADLAKTRRRLQSSHFGAGEEKLLKASEQGLSQKESEQIQHLARLQVIRQSLNSEEASLQKHRAAHLKMIQGRLTRRLNAQAKNLSHDLGRLFDLNEIFRFEVFAGSGENVRAMVVGGTKGRLPSSAKPTLKSLSWVFNGEIWLDEAGHLKSLMENRCTQ